MDLVIDNREHKLIKELDEYKHKVEQLELGDIIFREDSKDILIIERKTLTDLKASICDGRLKEQKARLQGSNTNIMYLIEGDLNEMKKHKFPVDTLVGSMINTELRDNIRIHRTFNIEETCKYIKKLHNKLSKDGSMFFKDTKVDYGASLKTKKKDNLTSDVWFRNTLSLIPQVSDKISLVIVDKYKTISNLILTYSNIPEELRDKLLVDIEYPIANNKTRKIGIKISQRIYNFLYKE